MAKKRTDTSLSLTITNKILLNKLKRNLENYHDKNLRMNALITNMIHNYINSKTLNLKIKDENKIKIPENYFKVIK